VYVTYLASRAFSGLRRVSLLAAGRRGRGRLLGYRAGRGRGPQFFVGALDAVSLHHEIVAIELAIAILQDHAELRLRTGRHLHRIIADDIALDVAVS